MNKEEFKVLVMLYVANVDGIQSEEIDTILEKTDSATFNKVKKIFAKMNDAEILKYIEENKQSFVATEEERKALLEGCRSIITSDNQSTVMEEFVIKSIEKVLA